MALIHIPSFSRANKIAGSDHTFRHVCPSLHPSVYLSELPLDGFSRNFIFKHFQKSRQENLNVIKILKNNGYYV